MSDTGGSRRTGTRRSTRRAFLAATAGVGAGALGTAGCLGLGGDAQTPTAVPETLPPATRGDGDVTVTVYKDLACPACKSFNEQFYPVIERDFIEPGVVTYEHRDFPLEMHAPRSFESANAARHVQSATDDETFFAYVDSVFANQGSMSPDTYARLAGELDASVDGDAVRSAAVGRIYRDTIDRDLSMGRDAGVRGTPTVFVDDEPVELNMRSIADAIDAARSDDS